jgi:hypothetical protein
MKNKTEKIVIEFEVDAGMSVSIDTEKVLLDLKKHNAAIQGAYFGNLDTYQVSQAIQPEVHKWYLIKYRDVLFSSIKIHAIGDSSVEYFHANSDKLYMTTSEEGYKKFIKNIIGEINYE